MESDELIQQEPFQVTVSITMSKTMTVYKENPGILSMGKEDVHGLVIENL